VGLFPVEQKELLYLKMLYYKGSYVTPIIIRKGIAAY